MRCPLCNKRKTAADDDICHTCRKFINKYIATGKIIRKTVPAMADIHCVMRELGVSQARAVALLGGTP